METPCQPARREFLAQAPMLGGVAAVWAVQDGSPPDDVLAGFRRSWARSTHYLLEVARAMPEDGFPFRPVPRVRTFAEQLDHIASSTYGFAALVRQAAPPRLPTRDSARVSAEVVADLEGALEYAAGAIAGLDAKVAGLSVPWGGRLYDDTPRMPLHGVVRVMHDHVSHHRGQLVVYLRLQGIEPPAYVD